MPWAAKTKKPKPRPHDATMPCRRYQKLYSRAAWKKLRLSWLRTHPLCVECLREGITNPASIVDHVQPHKGNHQMFFDMNNLQSLCKMHHDRKTYLESISGLTK